MARRKYTPEQIIGKLREVEVALAQGSTVALAVRGIEVTEQTHSTPLRAGSTTAGAGSTVGSTSNRLAVSKSWRKRTFASDALSRISHWIS